MSSRFLAVTITSFAVVCAVLGCGEVEPEFDPATRYTPASLADEIAFRCKTLDRNAAPLDRLDIVVPKGGATTKGGPVTKAARANTLDGLMTEMIDKASRIPNLPHAQACKKVAEEVAKNPAITEVDKKAITERLEKVTD